MMILHSGLLSGHPVFVTYVQLNVNTERRSRFI